MAQSGGGGYRSWCAQKTETGREPEQGWGQGMSVRAPTHHGGVLRVSWENAWEELVQGLLLSGTTTDLLSSSVLWPSPRPTAHRAAPPSSPTTAQWAWGVSRGRVYGGPWKGWFARTGRGVTCWRYRGHSQSQSSEWPHLSTDVYQAHSHRSCSPG